VIELHLSVLLRKLPAWLVQIRPCRNGGVIRDLLGLFELRFILLGIDGMKLEGHSLSAVRLSYQGKNWPTSWSKPGQTALADLKAASQAHNSRNLELRLMNSTNYTTRVVCRHTRLQFRTGFQEGNVDSHQRFFETPLKGRPQVRYDQSCGEKKEGD
jgi:hypothetical protein